MILSWHAGPAPLKGTVSRDGRFRECLRRENGGEVYRRRPVNARPPIGSQADRFARLVGPVWPFTFECGDSHLSVTCQYLYSLPPTLGNNHNGTTGGGRIPKRRKSVS